MRNRRLPQTQAVFAAWAVCVSALLGLPASATEIGKPPNIVIILAANMGYGDAGCYNKESKIPMPHIDRLAAQGMRHGCPYSRS